MQKIVDQKFFMSCHGSNVQSLRQRPKKWGFGGFQEKYECIKNIAKPEYMVGEYNTIQLSQEAFSKRRPNFEIEWTGGKIV